MLGAVAIAATIGVSCIDMSSPVGGVASISNLVLPSPSVVRGDTMRDSTGKATPLRARLLDGKGDTVRDTRVTFFVLDKGAHVDTAGLLYGDSLTTVRV